ncbi:MAG: hypothetical protein H0X64_05200 [Gemmatimonadaceae bacterium]|nr:hypothetical protein [Gemmatimonadaceae bacterium]
MHRLPGLALCAMLVALGNGCRSDSPAGGHRVVTARLVSQHQGDAAALILLPPGLEAVSAPTGTTLVTEPDGAGTRVLLFRDHPGRIEFQLRVTGQEEPTATILEVADGNNLPRNLAGYELRY